MDQGEEKPSANRSEQWNARYRELEAFKAEHGHCSVPQKLGTLGGWVNSQRTARNSGTLTEERVRKLDDIGFNWGTARGRRGTPMSWDDRLAELITYKTEHGHCNIPQSLGSLGKWVDNQRHQKRKGKLSDERVRKLNDIEFQWSPHNSLPTWDERLVELVQFKADHGHCGVSRRKMKSLAAWVESQRSRRKKGKLAEDRIKKLDVLGFEWNPGARGPNPYGRDPPSSERPPTEGGDRLRSDVPARAGTCGPGRPSSSAGVAHPSEGGPSPSERPPTRSADRPRLDADARATTGGGPARDERMEVATPPAAAEAAAVVVTIREPRRTSGRTPEPAVRHCDHEPPTWDECLDELLKYKAEHGHCKVPLSHATLGKWVATQRERVQKLDRIGFDWGTARCQEPNQVYATVIEAKRKGASIPSAKKASVSNVDEPLEEAEI